MDKRGTINYRGSEVIYSVFEKNKRYSALAKIILHPNEKEIIKSLTLDNDYATATGAEKKILQKSFEMLKWFYAKNIQCSVKH